MIRVADQCNRGGRLRVGGMISVLSHLTKLSDFANAHHSYISYRLYYEHLFAALRKTLIPVRKHRLNPCPISPRNCSQCPSKLSLRKNQILFEPRRKTFPSILYPPGFRARRVRSAMRRACTERAQRARCKGGSRRALSSTSGARKPGGYKEKEINPSGARSEAASVARI